MTDFEYKTFTSCDDGLIDTLYQLNCEIFSEFLQPFSREKMANTLTKVGGFHCVITYENDQPVGFKAGYRHSGVRFYSWLGGVLTSHRGLGLAKKMMTIQHQWAKENHFTIVETRTKNRFKGMLLTNIKEGFQIVGTMCGPNDNETVIILEKPL